MAVSLSDNHPFPLDAVAFNTFDHSSSVSFRTSASGANYGVITYTPRNTPGFDYDQFFTYPSANGAAAQFTFSFNASPAAARSYFLSAGAKDLTADLTSPSFLSPAEQAHALSALAEYAKFANIEFTQVSGAADIVFYHDERYGRTGFGRTDFDVSWSAGGDYRISNIVGLVGIGILNDPYMYVHELGHVFTLKHVGPIQQDSETPFLPSQYRDNLYSIMFYDVTSADITDPGERPTSHLQLFDVYALQQRFGPNMNWHAGNDVYTASNFDGLRQVLWDAGGTDTLDFSGQTANQIIDLREGAFSTLDGFSSLNTTKNLSIAYRAVIENAIGGSGPDKVIGNDANNVLSGRSGNDTLLGGVGSDQLDGGNDNDTLDGGPDDDALFGGAENDSLLGSIGDDTLAGQLGDDTVQGGSGNDKAHGNGGDDKVYGGSGDDKLTGSSGVDTLDGGDGNDQIFGNAGGDKLVGGRGDDLLVGLDGEDKFYAGGGADTLKGGTGNDTLLGGGGADEFEFETGTGHDIVTDFSTTSGDVIRLKGFGAAFDAFSDVQGAATQVGDDTVIDLGAGDTITLLGVTVGDLSAGDFLFG